MSPVDIGERYLELALRFRRLAPSLVDCYAGPPELADAVEAEPPPDEPDVAEQASELRAALSLAALPVERSAWLDCQLTAIGIACGWLAGDPHTYPELVEGCHGVTARVVEEECFRRAHDELEQALPGAGALRDRYQAWMAAQRVPAERVIEVISILAAELRSRTAEQFGLPDGESVSWEAVRGKRWAANADYRGSLHTAVELNVEVPMTTWRLLELAAHEAYPGHHTELVCKDHGLMQQHGCSELGVFVYCTPQAAMSEGLAMLALEVLLGDEADEHAAEWLGRAGIEYDGRVGAAVRRATAGLLPLRANVALMLDGGRLTQDQAWAYARRWLLEPDDHIDRLVSGIAEADWRPYESCYPEGLRLCREFVAGDPARFKRLLHEQLTPRALGG